MVFAEAFLGLSWEQVVGIVVVIAIIVGLWWFFMGRRPRP
jgi:protein-S-isoprenylcysteine O-methyltransferase Ste14